MNFTEITNKYYNRLTSQDFVIVKYIRAHLEKVIDMTSEELADNSYVSRSSVFRFIKRLNLSSFSELKLLIKNEVSIEEDKQSNYQVVLQKYHNYIDAALRHNNVSDIAKEIAKCNVLYIYGTGNEQKLQADIVQSSLSSLGIKVVILFDQGEYNYFKSMFTAKDMLMLISYKGENEEAINILKDSQLHNIYTIAVTRTSMNSMAQLADYQLLVPTESISTPTHLTYEINTTFYLMFDQLFFGIYRIKNETE